MGTLTASTTNWTNQNITLTGKATDIGSGISYYQFSTNANVTASSTEWKEITNTTSEITQTFSASSNATYYFYVKDKAGNINKKSIIVNKIDKTAPSISTFTTQDTTTTSIEVNVSASDSQSGIATYKYYLNGTLESTSTTNSYTFTGLTEGTSYTLKVVVTDNAGNSSEKTLTGKTDYPTVIEKLEEGDYLYYVDSTGVQRKCIVLYDKNSPYNEIQIITADTVEDVKIGNVNSYETTKLDYNNAISNLNIRANVYLNTTYASSARCVGSIPNNPDSESGLYSRSETWFTKWNNTFKDEDVNYVYDWNQMNHLNIHNIDKIYWLASRLIYTKGSYSSFDVRIVYINATLNDYGFISTHSDGNYYLVENTAGLRPVFTLKDTVKITGGNGTENSPYLLGI